jgi:hypothetical protein
MTEETMLKENLLPVWYDEKGRPRFDQPKELTSLRLGEQLLIQMAAPYVPLVHIKNGTLGIRGHVCSFPQRIADIANKLPRLPADVTHVKMVRSFRNEDNEIGTKAFVIRRHVVLRALRWLKRFNVNYKDIEIDEANLDWMEGQDEAELPGGEVNPDAQAEEAEHGDVENTGDDEKEEEPDLGPAPRQTQKPQCGAVESTDDVDLSTCGVHVMDSPVVMTEEDAEIADELKKAAASSTTKMPRMEWPAVSEEPISEYDAAERLFCKAFPWLFPGGVGDINDYREKNVEAKQWASDLLYYQDGRFASDRMWCFFVLNYTTRRRNAGQGKFFVDKFYKDCPVTLEDLKQKIRDGDTSYIDRISYFSKEVEGSAPYWRAKRAELYTWINHHVAEGNGGPQYFITLSCAEYHWPDIQRLLEERKSYFPEPPDDSGESVGITAGETADGTRTADTAAGRAGTAETGGADRPKHSRSKEKRDAVREADDLSIVIQEYFQERVKIFLDTVGKKILGIEHYWLRYEFAPSRGQVHVHLLAIANASIRKFFKKIHGMEDNPSAQAKLLQEWLERLMNYTACVDESKADPARITPSNNPCRRQFTDIADKTKDAAELQMFCQKHECSCYCMRSKKKRKSQTKTSSSKQM